MHVLYYICQLWCFEKCTTIYRHQYALIPPFMDDVIVIGAPIPRQLVYLDVMNAKWSPFRLTTPSSALRLAWSPSRRLGDGQKADSIGVHRPTPGSATHSACAQEHKCCCRHPQPVGLSSLGMSSRYISRNPLAVRVLGGQRPVSWPARGSSTGARGRVKRSGAAPGAMHDAPFAPCTNGDTPTTGDLAHNFTESMHRGPTHLLVRVPLDT